MEISRRQVIKGAAATAVAPAAGMSVEATQPADGRFIVDTNSTTVDRLESKAEIVWNLPEINLAVVEAENGVFDGTSIRASRDLEVRVAPPDPIDQADVTSPESATIESGHEISQEDQPSPHPFQWDKQSQNIQQLHSQGITGEGASIAIVDTGVSPNHPDLAPNVNVDKARNYASGDDIPVNPSEPTTAGSHGTHVAGIAAASGETAAPGEPYVVGVAPDAEIIPIRVLPPSSLPAFLSDLIAAITGAAKLDADVANFSLGTYNLPRTGVREATINRDLVVEAHVRVAEFAYEQGMLLVASAGNSDSNLDQDEERTGIALLNLPGELDRFVQVSATGPITDPGSFDPRNPDFGSLVPFHGPSAFTNYGPEALDLSAAGGNGLFFTPDGVLSTVVPGDGSSQLNGNYDWYNGTSMSSPQVAGAAALVKAQNPGLAPRQVKQHLENTSRHIPFEYPNLPLFGDVTYLGSDTNSQTPGDLELEDSYSSTTYRGEGHLDIERAVTKDYPDALEGGVRVGGEVIYPADPDDDGLYEDVRGDTPTDVAGVDMADIQTLYQIAVNGSISRTAFSPGQGFDFKGDGVFDMRDVQALLRQVE